MIRLLKENQSADGSIKYLFELNEKWKYEAIIFAVDRFQDGSIVCLSTQSGCNMHCAFCATGKLGYCHDLPAEIMLETLDEIKKRNPERKIIMAALMGMGEPLMNYKNVVEFYSLAKKKYDCDLTLSSVGVTEKILELADSEAPYKLYISLHFSEDGKRSRYMPVNKNNKIADLLSACRIYYDKHPENGKIQASYLLLKGINDTETDISRLGDILDPAVFSIQLLLYNSTTEAADARFKRMDLESAEKIRQRLAERGFEVYVMPSAGTDVGGGCGQMAGR